MCRPGGPGLSAEGPPPPPPKDFLTLGSRSGDRSFKPFSPVGLRVQNSSWSGDGGGPTLASGPHTGSAEVGGAE